MASILLEAHGMCRGKKKPVNAAGFFFTALVSKKMWDSLRNAEEFHRARIFEEASISLDKTGAGVRK
jgi:hypothetical protein